MSVANKQHHLPEFVLLLAVFVWGTTFSLVKVSLAYTSPFMFITLRFTLALIIMTAVVGPSLGRISRRELVGGALTGGSLFIGFAFQTWGLVYTTASKSAFITGLNVVLVPFFLWAIVHQEVRARRWLAAGLATVGLYLLVDPTGSAGLNQGDVLTLGCAVAFAVQIILLGIYAPTIHILRYFWVQLVTVAVLAALSTAAWGTWQFTGAASFYWGLGITGVLGTVLAFLAQIWAQRRISPTRTALILTAEPVFGALFAVVMMGELLTAVAWLGGGLIVGSIIWSEVGS